MMTFTGKSGTEIETDAYQRFPILAQRAKQTAGTMSGGEQQMLALSRGLACDPAVLLLDELSMGLARSSSSSCTARWPNSPGRASPSRGGTVHRGTGHGRPRPS